MKKNLLYLITGSVLFLLFIILLIIDKSVGDRPITGFLGNINNTVDYKYNHTVDVISDLLLYASFIFVACAIVLGILQLIKNKSLFKVDRIIIIYGIFAVLSLALWIFFDKIIKTSYRPLNDENSYPSTHVFVFIYFSSFGTIILSRFIKNELLKKILLLLTLIIGVVLMPTLRVLCGMHYITDVFGGVLLGLSLFFISIALSIKNEKNNEIEHDN